MNKLLAAYRATPTLKNAQKVRSYDRSHPMAACMLSREDADLLADAIHQANMGEGPRLDGGLAREMSNSHPSPAAGYVRKMEGA